MLCSFRILEKGEVAAMYRHMYSTSKELITEMICQVPATNTRHAKFQLNLMREGLPYLPTECRHSDWLPLGRTSYTCVDCDIPGLVKLHSMNMRQSSPYILRILQALVQTQLPEDFEDIPDQVDRIKETTGHKLINEISD